MASMNPQDAAVDEGSPLLQQDEDRLRHPSKLMLGLLCAVSFFDGADATLLPATFMALEKDLNMSPSQLGFLMMSQSLCASVMSPVWAVLADRGQVSRKQVLVGGCLGWSILTMVLASTSSLAQMVPLRILNGAMLGTMFPISQGLIADTTSPAIRGRYFGYVDGSGNWGRMVSLLVGAPLSMMTLCGMSGWRVVFLGFGVLSLLVTALVKAFFVEPDREAEATHQEISVSEELGHLARYFRIPTFALTVVQGLFGSCPWSALGFSTMYLQLRGIGDWTSSMLVSLSMLMIGFGALFGGWAGDKAAQVFGLHGRPLVAQISIFSCIPFCILIFYVVKAGPDTVWLLAILMASVGFTSSWTHAGVKRPILAEIVEPEDRSVVVAWDASLEGSAAALLGAPSVAILAEKVFGYPLNAASHAASTVVADPAKADALGKALTCATAVPWGICLIIFSFIHWSYPRDLQRLAEQRELRQANKPV